MTEDRSRLDPKEIDLQAILEQVQRDMAPRIGDGRVADYIPALAQVDPRRFGLAIATCDGQEAAVGDVDEPFSIQSISKVFTLAMALDSYGRSLWDRVGREPSGSAFNSIVQLERERGIPRNPFINAGAIVVTDALTSGRSADDTIAAIEQFVRDRTGDMTITVDPEVAASEADTGHRNRSLAYFMKAFGNLRCPPEQVLKVYFQQCALAMSCRQLARAGLFLAADGFDPRSDHAVLARERARRINAVMMTCGHYDASGEFAFRVGLPGKSGVGGGILAIAPRRAAFAVWSPGLNAVGNSLVGTLALERFTTLSGWSVF